MPTPGGGAGTYHAATAYGLTAYLGVPESGAKAATIVLHLVVFGSSMFFGVYYFLRSGVGLARLRDLAAHEREEEGEGAAPAEEGKDLTGETARAHSPAEVSHRGERGGRTSGSTLTRRKSA